MWRALEGFSSLLGDPFARYSGRRANPLATSQAEVMDAAAGRSRLSSPFRDKKCQFLDRMMQPPLSAPFLVPFAILPLQ